jgi:hypothetical protein
MRRPCVDDVVRVRHDLPELSVRRGDQGVIRSLWFSSTVYEVEFGRRVGLSEAARALLQAEELEIADGRPAKPN